MRTIASAVARVSVGVVLVVLPACGADDAKNGQLATLVVRDRVVAAARIATATGTQIEQKILSTDGTMRVRFVDDSGDPIADPYVTTGVASRIDVGPRLSARLKDARDTDVIVVDVFLGTRDLEEALVPEVGSARLTASGRNEVAINGQMLDASQLREYGLDYQRRLQARRLQRAQVRAAHVSSLHEWLGVSSAAATEWAEREGPLVLSLPVGRITKLIAEPTGPIFVEGIDIHSEGVDGSMATARTATSTRTVDMVGGATGSGVGIYMTETGCPPSGFLTNYTLLAGSNTDHSRNVSSILRTVSPDSWIYCRGGAVLPSASDLAGSGGHPSVQIVTRSNRFVSPNSSPYNSGNAGWDDWIYNNRILTVVLAGNEGLDGLGGMGAPSSGLNVLTVGNYDDTTIPYTMNLTSSFLDPTSKNAKPELSAPGTNIDAGGFTFTGTSMATPFVSAIGANLLHWQPFLTSKAALMKATLIAAANDVIGSGFGGAGYGGIDYFSGVWGSDWWAAEGNNAVFAVIDATDAIPNSNSLDVVFSATTGQTVHVAMAWLTRGSYTLGHLNDPHPIGIDLDLVIFDPSGNSVGNSSSFDNPMEVVTFTAATTGNYMFKVFRYANRDLSSNLSIGVTINRD